MEQKSEFVVKSFSLQYDFWCKNCKDVCHEELEFYKGANFYLAASESFIDMLHLSEKLQLFTKIMISANYSI